MANKHLSNKPQNVKEDVLWYHEEPRGINIVHEIREGARYIRTDQITIPWGKIRASLRRKDKK
jgi:hypothetical protein